MSKTPYYIDLEERFGAHNYPPLDVVITRASGAWVWDVDGNRYMDCLAAYSAVNQGHCHPRIRQALIDQSYKVTLTSRAFRSDQLGLFFGRVDIVEDDRRRVFREVVEGGDPRLDRLGDQGIADDDDVAAALDDLLPWVFFVTEGFDLHIGHH